MGSSDQNARFRDFGFVRWLMLFSLLLFDGFVSLFFNLLWIEENTANAHILAVVCQDFG